MTLPDPDLPDQAFKLADHAEWEAARAAGVYAGSPVDLADGFIHLSDADQLPGTAAKYFAGLSDLILARIDLTVLGDQVKWEPSRGGALFPHIYGDLPMSAVLDQKRVSVDAEGRIVETAW